MTAKGIAHATSNVKFSQGIPHASSPVSTTSTLVHLTYCFVLVLSLVYRADTMTANEKRRPATTKQPDAANCFTFALALSDDLMARAKLPAAAALRRKRCSVIADQPYAFAAFFRLAIAFL